VKVSLIFRSSYTSNDEALWQLLNNIRHKVPPQPRAASEPEVVVDFRSVFVRWLRRRAYAVAAHLGAGAEVLDA
jgi:hypothetical protein